MESISDPDLLHDFFFFKVYKDGRIEKICWPPVKIPPSDDPITGVRSKDVVISNEPEVSARIFLPPVPDSTHKLPVFVYSHGGGFAVESAFAPHYDRHARRIAAASNAITVSVEYRLAPEHPLPACYDDCWSVLQWVASHSDRNGAVCTEREERERMVFVEVRNNGPDKWLNDHADLNRVFVGGDSAGGNLSHNMALRVGTIGLPGIHLVGAILTHSYFRGVELYDKLWMYICPTNKGYDDPMMKPPAEDLAKIGCERVLVFVAEKDLVFEADKAYCEDLMKSGWKGTVEMVVNEGEGHLFYLHDPTNKNAVALIQKIASFINQE